MASYWPTIPLYVSTQCNHAASRQYRYPSLSDPALRCIELISQIFRGLKSFTMDDPIQSSLLKLSAKGISVFSPHTSLDATPNGINTWYVHPLPAGFRFVWPCVLFPLLGRIFERYMGLHRAELISQACQAIREEHNQI